MSKVLVLYYSSSGHIETMAQAVAEGARAGGASVDVKRVPETVPADVAQNAHFKTEQAAPVATVAELESVTDFFAFGEEIWRAADPAAALKALIAEMG